MFYTISVFPPTVVSSVSDTSRLVQVSCILLSKGQCQGCSPLKGKVSLSAKQNYRFWPKLSYLWQSFLSFKYASQNTGRFKFAWSWRHSRCQESIEVSQYYTQAHAGVYKCIYLFIYLFIYLPSFHCNIKIPHSLYWFMFLFSHLGSPDEGRESLLTKVDKHCVRASWRNVANRWKTEDITCVGRFLW